MERMSPLDAMFLDTEDGDRHASMAIASVAVVAGPAPRREEIIDAIAGRLPLVPRYRQTFRRVPFDLSQPVWVDDLHFDIGYHVRATALPAPADEAALCRLVAWIMSQRLDRERPLWEYWVIEGLPGRHWALVSKVHHCMVDGVGGNHLYRLLFDESPTPGPALTDSWQPEPPPTPVELTLDALGDLVRVRIRGLEQLSRAVLTPQVLGQRIAETTAGLAALAGSIAPGTPSSLTGRIGASRRYGLARVPFPDIARVAKAFQVSVNDVVLAAVTSAFRELLLRRQERPDRAGLRTMVPVSVRAQNARTIIDNRVSMMLPLLPVDIADAVERLHAVHSRLAVLKAAKEAEAGDAMNTFAQYESFSLRSVATRLAARLPQRNIVTVATNVPGPRNQLYILGRPIVELLPYVPIAGQMRIGVSVMTYLGQAVFGVTGDYDSAPEVDDFAASLAAGISDLLGEVARGGSRVASPARPPRQRRASAEPTHARGASTPIEPVKATRRAKAAPVTETAPRPKAARTAKPVVATSPVKRVQPGAGTRAPKAGGSTKAAHAARSTKPSA